MYARQRSSTQRGCEQPPRLASSFHPCPDGDVGSSSSDSQSDAQPSMEGKLSKLGSAFGNRHMAAQCCCAARHVPAAFLFTGLFLVYGLRVCVSTTAQVPPPDSTVVTMYTEFAWDGKTQGAVLSAFFYGYVVLQIAGAMVATKIGGKRVFAAGILVSAIGTVLTPLTAAHLPALLAARALTGLGEGVTYPAMVALLAKWTPPSERSATMAFCSAGAYIGTAVSLPLCSEIMHRWGWRAVFYGLGGASLAWLIPFMIFVYDRPEAAPGIAAAELILIRGAIRGAAAPAAARAVVGEASYGSAENSAATDSDCDDEAALRSAGRLRTAAAPLSMLSGAKRDARILWLMLTRPALWATTVAACAYSWMFYTLLTELPSYFTTVLQVSVREANIASILPWAVIFATTTLGGQLCDALIRRDVVTTLNARRAFALAGFLPAAALLVATAYVRGDNTIAIAAMSMAMGSLGLAISSWSVNCLDIGGAYAGVAYAFVNTISNLMGAIAPLVCGVFTDALGDAEGYAAVFWLSAALNVLGALVFVVFVSVDSVEKRVDAADALRATPAVSLRLGDGEDDECASDTRRLSAAERNA